MPICLSTHSSDLALFTDVFSDQKIHLRALGSCALSMAYVACGRLDGYFSTTAHPWDVAAGALFLQEARCKIGTFNDDPFDIKKDTGIICAREDVYDVIAPVLKESIKTS